MSTGDILMAIGALGLVLNIALLIWKLNLIETKIKIIFGEKKNVKK